MDAQEIDIALDELENRLDRLRSLYEQYFLGIEKIEPGVARKDVDRRFWLLRRTQIRNTARRFRLQTLVQRYNTFQQYWARICREIENGTYSRHLLRAQKNVGQEPKTWAAKKRLGHFRKKEGDNGASQPPGPADDLGALLDGKADLDAEAARAAEEALVLAEARAAEVKHAEADSPMVRAMAQAPNATPPRPAVAQARRRTDLEMLDLDFDDGLGPVAPAPRPIARPAPSPASARPAMPSAIPVRPAPPRATTSTPARPPLPVPRRAAVPAQPSAAPVAPPRAPAPSPAAAAPASPAPVARVQIPKPAPRVAAERPQQPARPAAAVQSTHGISDDRLKQIHSELAAAKRQANQRDSVSLDALSKSLRESEKKIRAQHPGKAVDFHVVTKDGKPIVKPIVRK